MADTNIEWADRVWNPVRGCAIVSPGCVNCYAMKQAHRFSGKGQPYEGLTKLTKAGPQWTGKARPMSEMLTLPLKWRKPSRIFVNSMSDLFHEDVPDEFIDKVWGVMSLTPRHTYQILTKRPERMRALVPTLAARHAPKDGSRWPLPNVHLGVSVENQPTADERIPLLLQTPAAVRWVSYEPALAAVDFTHVAAGPLCPNHPDHRVDALRAGTWTLRTGLTHVSPEFVNHNDMERLDWVVVGGESGPGARPFDIQWARDVVRQCKAAAVPCFVKQLGARPTGLPLCWSCGGTGEAMLNRETGTGAGQCDCRDGYQELFDRKGGDMSEWPKDLRVRQYPESR